MLKKFFWFHSQSLSDKKLPLWRAGRCWFHFKNSKIFSLEWYFWKRSINPALIFTIGGEEDYQLKLHFSIPFLFSVWIGFENFLPEKWFKDWQFWGVYGRDIGIKFHSSNIWIYLFHNDLEVHFPKNLDITGINFHLSRKIGMLISIDLADLILGREKYRSWNLITRDCDIDLPEGSYPVSITLFNSVWDRPRWITRSKIRARIESEKGIPAHAGKGENSYDLDDSIIYSWTLPVESFNDAIEKCRSGILRDRARYGNPSLINAKMEST